LKFNETTQHWETGEINWEEFNNIIKGNGPCNKERVAARKNADRNGSWVRQAAQAYANKKLNKALS
jgi:ring-1,2-phenylacetyl-CoA epoxidase subunit PaaA